MKNVLSLFVGALVLASAFALPAQAVSPTVLNVIVDAQRRQTLSVGPRIYVNQAVNASAAASVSATCPAEAQFIQFFPGSAGDFSTKVNGSGVPSASAVTDGTGWIKNLADIQPINQTYDGVTISSYAVQSDVVPNKVPYVCFK